MRAKVLDTLTMHCTCYFFLFMASIGNFRLLFPEWGVMAFPVRDLDSRQRALVCSAPRHSERVSTAARTAELLRLPPALRTRLGYQTSQVFHLLFQADKYWRRQLSKSRKAAWRSLGLAERLKPHLNVCRYDTF